MSDSPINKSRRGFFTGSLLTREGRQKVAKQINRLGLVPPGLTIASTDENCSNCSGYCAQSCPQQIIRIHSEDHELNGQPYLDFSANGCTFCNECFTACPQTSGHQSTQTSLGKAHLNQQQCYAWLNIICMSCISVCPDQLIKFDKSSKPTIQLENCTGCGSCIKVCPATAINIIEQTAA